MSASSRAAVVAVLLLFAAPAALAQSFAAGCSPCTPPANGLYVATWGNDVGATGTVAKPFGTVNGALAYVSANGLSTNLSADLTIEVLPGDYWGTAATWPVGASGSNGHRVVVHAFNGVGTVRLLGASKIDTTTCTISSGSTYKCPVAGTFWTMWEDGVRGVMARTPNLSAPALFPMSHEPYVHTTGVDTSYTSMTYSSGDFNPAAWNLGETLVYMWSGGGWNWFANVNPVSALNTGTTTYTMTNNTQWPIYQSSTGSRYFMEGPCDLLDQAGEWCLDGGYLYYWPRAGALTGHEIAVPSTARVISAVGTDQTHRLHDITIENLEVDYSDFVQWYRYADWGTVAAHPSAGAGYVCPVYAFEQPLAQNHQAAIYLENVDHVTVQRSKIQHTGLGGIYAYNAAQSVVLTNNRVQNCGWDCVTIEGFRPGEGDVSFSNEVSKSFINHMGELAAHGAGVRLLQSHDNLVTKNEIHDGARNGVFVVGGCSDTSVVSYTYNNEISYSKVYNVGQDSGDMGGVGAYLLDSQPGFTQYTNTFKQLVIWHVQATSAMTDAGPNGVFTDNETHSQHFQNVWVRDTQGAFLRINDSGDHTATNCSFNADASVNGSFDVTQMDTANIGVPSSNPY
jgi:hypothetical protein